MKFGFACMCFFYLKFGNNQRKIYTIDCNTVSLLGHLEAQHIDTLREWVHNWTQEVERDLLMLESENAARAFADRADGGMIPPQTSVVAAVAPEDGLSVDEAHASSEVIDLVDLLQLKREQQAALAEASAKLIGLQGVALTLDTGEVVLHRSSGERAKEHLQAKRTYILSGERRSPGSDGGGGAGGDVITIPLTFAVPPDKGPSIQSILGESMKGITVGGDASTFTHSHRRVVSEHARPPSPSVGDRPGHQRSQTDGGALFRGQGVA